MLRISPVTLKPGESTELLPRRIAGLLREKKLKIKEMHIVRESVDARKRSQIHFVYTVDFSVDQEASDERRGGRTAGRDTSVDLEARLLKKASGLRGIRLIKAPDESYHPPRSGYEGTQEYAGERPVVVGFGPCGMFAGLLLAEAGLRPVILEQGCAMDQRKKDVTRFWKEGVLDEHSNVQFGEGGAGTFSDGKLTTGTKRNALQHKVFDEFIEAGAHSSIRYSHTPHIGTDVLQRVVVAIRKKIESLGGEVRFECCVDGLVRDEDGGLAGLKLQDGSTMTCRAAVLCPGNSARDTFVMLEEEGVALTAKPFSVGVRIEHPQAMINRVQYGEANDSEGRLSAAVYKLSHHCEDGRGVYTFCMCPGGYVVASASEQEGVVTNGMSYSGRDGNNANSALLVSVSPEDCQREMGIDGPLAGIYLQREMEQRAYRLGGENYRAPAQRVGSFLRRDSDPGNHAADYAGNDTSVYEGNEAGNGAGNAAGNADFEQKKAGGANDAAGGVEPTYEPGVCWTELSECLPSFVTEAMKEALPQLARRLRGFDMDDAVLTGVETRSSSPVRIVRDETLQSISLPGLYPGGEGAGYAGGIMSSAVDGLRIAEEIIRALGKE